MIFRVGMREKIERNAQLVPTFQEFFVVLLGDFGGADTFLLRPQGDGRAVLIAAGYHKHIVAFQAVIARKNIRRQITASYMAQV
jgi:hypothetical protein